MANSSVKDRKKKWLNRLREGRREQAAIEATAASTIVERRQRERQAIANEITAAIAAVPNQDHRAVLFLRYVKCLDWHEVAAVMHFSQRHVMRLHSEAVNEIKLPSRRQLSGKNVKQ